AAPAPGPRILATKHACRRRSRRQDCAPPAPAATNATRPRSKISIGRARPNGVPSYPRFPPWEAFERRPQNPYDRPAKGRRPKPFTSPVHRRSHRLGLQTARSSRTHQREVRSSNPLPPISGRPVGRACHMPARGRARPAAEARERLAQAAVHERLAKAAAAPERPAVEARERLAELVPARGRLAAVRGQLAEAPVRGRQERVAA